MRKLTLCVLATCLCGCQTWGPTWSELTGKRWNLTSINAGPIVISQVDGDSPDTGPIVKVTPGMHKLVLQAIPPPSVMGNVHFGESTFEAKPCVRYYINARFVDSTSPQWSPFVDYEESIPGCQLPAASGK